MSQSKRLETPRTSPGMQETLDQLHALSGSRKPEIMAKLFAPKLTSTPGPWQIMNDYDGATIVIANVDGETFADGTSTFSYDFVCDTLPDDGDGSRSREIAIANARLIVTAVNSYASSQAEIERLRTAAQKLLDHWDQNSGPEKRGEFEGVEYWSPAGRMVSTEFIAELRTALGTKP